MAALLRMSFVPMPRMLSRPLHTRNSGMMYMLDTNIATLILDGELWNRSPSTMMSYRPEFFAAVQEATNYQDAYKYNSVLSRSIQAYKWATKYDKPLIISATVQMELDFAPQVS